MQITFKYREANMTDGKLHGTDCFEVESFIQRNGSSKLYQVKHKESGEFFTMEVSPRDENSKAPISPYVQQTNSTLSRFWVNLRFTFQTRSKFYYILDFVGKESLKHRITSFGSSLIPVELLQFYAAEILIALEELHQASLAYKDLSLETVYLDSEGHVVMWRSFCGKFYWSKQECVCSLKSFHHGDPCENNHNLKSEFDFQEDWKSFGAVIKDMFNGESCLRTQTECSLPAAASDLIHKLLRGDVSRAEQIQSHPFFAGVNWHEVKARNSRPPMGSINALISIPRQTNSSPGYFPAGSNADTGALFQKPRSTSRNSEPKINTIVGTGTSLNERQGTLHNTDTIIGPKTENGPLLQRPRSVSRHSDPTMSTYVAMDPVFNDTRTSGLKSKKPNESSMQMSRRMTRQADPTLEAHENNGTPSAYRPHCPSHHSDPGDYRYATGITNHIASGLTLHMSSPDLRDQRRGSSDFQHQQQLPVDSTCYQHGNRDYHNTVLRDFSGNPLEEKKTVSRSMSDLSNLGNDSGFASHSPAALERKFVYPRYEGVSRATVFYSQRDETQPFDGEGGLRSSGSVPDLTTSSSQFSAPYPISQSARASPTPSQRSEIGSQFSYAPKLSPRKAFAESRSRFSDTDLSLNESGYGTMERESTISSQKYMRESSRLSEDLQSKSETPCSFGRQQNTSPSNLSRSLDSALLRSEIPMNRSSTRQSSTNELNNAKKSDSIRKSNDKGCGKTPTLTRAVSLSNFGEDKSLLEAREMTEKRRDSLPLAIMTHREKHPLANVPIPSFREFKEKNLEKASKSSILGEGEGLKSFTKSAGNDSKINTNTTSASKDRLSLLYESSKDILAQNKTRKTVETYKLSSSDKEDDSASSVKENELNFSRNDSKERQDSPFSKNEVIHQLMLKYGLYGKQGLEPKNPENERTSKCSDGNNSEAKETSNEESERTLSTNAVESKKNTRNSTDHANGANASGKRQATSSEPQHKANKGLCNEAESKKSAAERFRELKRKGGLRNEKVGGSSNSREDASKRNVTERASNKNTEKDAYATHSKGDFNKSSVPGEMNSRILASANEKKDDETSASQVGTAADSPNGKKSTAYTLRGTSRAILCAKQFKKTKKLNSPGGSPLPNKKQFTDIIGKGDVSVKQSGEGKDGVVEKHTKDTMEVEESDSPRSLSPSPRRRRLRSDRGIRRRGIHTSMLSVASSAYSDTDIDDSVSMCSEADSVDDERGTRGRRWDSFHSNISADSGSAHMYEFETDSNVTEYDDVFDVQESEDDRPKNEIDVERTDSGVGGDLGQSHLRRSWEEIVMKSSEQWSVVAASARHWQELARRKKAEQSDIPAPRKKSSAHSITEDMVECPDCLKHYIPQKEIKPGSEPEICSKCEDRKVERKEAIIELVQTEINYGNDLQILKEEFYVPMQSGGILSPENLSAIFLNLQELLEANSKFCAKLQKSLEESVAKGDEEFSEVNVGAIFLESVDFFQAYELYCSKQTSASSLLESLQKKAELLRIFLNVTCRQNPKCRKMDLNSFILAPVQRIMKYPLLISRICKATPKRNTDREKLKMAQRKIEEQLNKINALNTAVESRQKRYRGSQQLGRSDSLDKMQMEKMASEILNWSTGEMQLLMHGVFQVTIHEFGAAWNRRNYKKALSVCALFCVRGHSEYLRIDSDDDGECGDLLFPCESDITDAAVVLLRKKLNGRYTLLKDPLFLDMCIVSKESDVKDAFEIVSVGKESYLFKASNSKEYRKWLKYLRLESKELGSWKRRRNGLPNIMIKNL